MAKRTSDDLVATSHIEEIIDDQPRVGITLPKLESAGNVKVDEYEHVTINGETTLVKRGVYVEVTVPVYMQLKNKFPEI